MADEEQACDLCGLPVEKNDFTIYTQGTTLHFCCEGCEGIYRMMNDVDEVAGASDSGSNAAE